MTDSKCRMFLLFVGRVLRYCLFERLRRQLQAVEGSRSHLPASTPPSPIEVKHFDYPVDS